MLLIILITIVLHLLLVGVIFEDMVIEYEKYKRINVYKLRLLYLTSTFHIFYIGLFVYMMARK